MTIEGCRVLAGMRCTCTLIEGDGLWFEGSDDRSFLFRCGWERSGSVSSFSCWEIGLVLRSRMVRDGVEFEVSIENQSRPRL